MKRPKSATQSPTKAKPRTPLFRQLYERMRSSILSGDLAPGTRVPSWNDLAAELKIARGTVKAAYDCLTGEGFLISRGAAGTFVNTALIATLKAPTQPTKRTLRSRMVSKPQVANVFGLIACTSDLPRPFQMGLPALDVFPRALWSRLVARRARALHPTSMAYQQTAGDANLRAALASYLAVARGIGCTAEQVFITTGYSGALDLITRVLLQPHDTVLLEDPGYPPARVAMQLAGAHIVPVRVDEHGMQVDSLSQRAANAKLAIVTPSHQAPLGMPLSLPRRLALIEWATRQRAWIVEDDYYSEFRLQGRPLPALASLNQQRVLYVGTFSKVLLPSLRLGYVVVPPALQEAFTRITRYLAPSSSPLMQAVIADFMQQGHFARHIRRMTSVYHERRAALVSALQNILGSETNLKLRESALHLVLPLARRHNDVSIATRAAELGLAPSPLTPWIMQANNEPALLMSFANVPAKDAVRYVKQLATLITTKPSVRKRRGD
jgi:GntR family transcriptional regulator/MocR family aminotransferase